MPRLAAVECVDNASIHEAMEQRVLPRAAHDIRFFADFAVERLAKPPRALPGDERNAVRRDPAGVAAVSTPWNASFMLATWRVGPALAAGCTVVLKPPEWAPLTCSLLGDLADATGKIAAYQSDNSGQVCLADTHLLVERSILDEFAERFRAQAAAIEVGDPRDAATTYGPLIHPVALELATGHVARAVEQGARLTFGSESLGGPYYATPLFTDVPPGDDILRREVFGPVLTLQSFEDETAAIALANDTDYGPPPRSCFRFDAEAIRAEQEQREALAAAAGTAVS